MGPVLSTKCRTSSEIEVFRTSSSVVAIMLHDAWRGAHWFAVVLHRVEFIGAWLGLGLGLQVQTN
jgi:hypothetical protein